jgi:hypothetical protein
MSRTRGISLSSYTMDGEEDGQHLLVRVAIINADDTLSLPVRELWVKRNARTNEVEYMKYSANSAHDEDQEHLSLAEANEAMRTEGGPWLRSLDAKGRISFGSVGGSDRWFPTALVRAEESIWQKLNEPERTLSTTCYIIDEDHLKIWLELREKKEVEGANKDDDEDDWTGISDDEPNDVYSDAEENESEEEENNGGEGEEEGSDDGFEPWGEADDPNGDVPPRPTPQETIESLQVAKYATVKVDDDSQCTVCREQFKDEQLVVTLPCKHIFCEGTCILEWLKNNDSCPLCRAKVSSETTKHESEDSIVEGEDEAALSG